jgi:hypothetical protein
LFPKIQYKLLCDEGVERKREEEEKSHGEL